MTTNEVFELIKTKIEESGKNKILLTDYFPYLQQLDELYMTKKIHLEFRREKCLVEILPEEEKISRKGGRKALDEKYINSKKYLVKRILINLEPTVTFEVTTGKSASVYKQVLKALNEEGILVCSKHGKHRAIIDKGTVHIQQHIGKLATIKKITVEEFNTIASKLGKAAAVDAIAKGEA